MPVVRFYRDGEQIAEIDIAKGNSVMHGAIVAGLNGIVGECGGEMVCASCHVFVLSHGDEIPELSPTEDEMLDFTVETRQPCSRLSCQIKMTDKLDGLVLGLPKAQV
ncbi:2Fe-2S iron-sulfur cluster-binding protein [Nitratireductor alexandrii]|uniref:2Fe-2S iron-sulfur cluster-binding protein n=1 Tax=Nitratireductor alexandrii TaxID=2448161 RepID=UPI000FDCDD81|nr:2Fe-2S iron-sulfur cluster-binding protein [Nitratireductor alexandrii]